MPSIVSEVGETFVTLFKGFSVTLRTMFGKTTTESFPDVPPSVQPAIAASTSCSATKTASKNVSPAFSAPRRARRTASTSKPRKIPKPSASPPASATPSVYNIDYSRCIFCGYCVEACPTDAITHGHSIELAPYDINALIYRKEQLLEPWPPRSNSARA